MGSGVILTFIALFIARRLFVRFWPRASPPEDGWELLWNLRRAALERAFGAAEDSILTAMPPFYLGGGADVLTFRRHLDGVVYTTASLIGDELSKPNRLGQYELMICVREDAPWAADLISRPARYTAEAILSPHDTLDTHPIFPQPTELSTLLFLPYVTVRVGRQEAVVMLCVGITAEELQFIHDHGVEDLVSRLKARQEYPYTDLRRGPVVRG